MDQTSEARVKEIEERLQKASPGPWSAVNIYKILSFGPDAFADHRDDMPNAEFIAHAPDDIRYLLDELKKAREEIGELEADLKANAAMLAKQCDRAMSLEIDKMESRRELWRSHFPHE